MATEWGRIAVISLVVIALQQLLGSFILGLYPTLTEFSLLGIFKVGSFITTGLGVIAGDLIYMAMKKKRK